MKNSGFGEPKLTTNQVEPANEWVRKETERNRDSLEALVNAVSRFLEKGEAIDREVIKNGIDAERSLSWRDEKGGTDEGMTVYLRKRELGIEGETFYQDTKRRAPKFNDALFYATGAANWMRGPNGDMSHTVPLELKREMIAAEIVQLGKFASFYNSKISSAYHDDGYKHLDEEVEALGQECRQLYRLIQDKANPYICADMQVAIDHMDEYKRLREEFLRVDGERSRLVGEWASLTTRNVLSKVYADEYQTNLAHFQADKKKQINLTKRNELVKWGNDFDQEWTRDHPYRD